MTAAPTTPATSTPGDHGDRRATVPQAVAAVLRERAEVLFGLMGNGNAHLISELTSTGFTFVPVRHEAGAVAAADAYFRASGQTGTATVTYGAGFTNTVTALTEAAMARIPLVVVVGDGPSTGPRFFDIDQVGMAAAAGVETVTLDAHDPAARVREAYDRAAAERRPIVVAIPYDLVEEPVEEPVEGPEEVPVEGPVGAGVGPEGGRGGGTEAGEAATEVDDAALEPLLAALRGAERPLLVAGRGVVDSPGAPEALRELADRLGALLANTVMARNVAGPDGDLGIVGGFGRLDRVEIIRQADVVLVLGAGMNPFQMRYGTIYGPEAAVLQVDLDPERRHERSDHFLAADTGAVLRGLAARLAAEDHAPAGGGWRARQVIPAAPGLHAPLEEGRGGPVAVTDGIAADGRLDPRAMALALEELLPRERTFVQDGGHFIGWIPLTCSVPDPRSHLFVGTAFQSIGLGLPAALGAAIARPDRTTVLVTGDGGGLMALADLESFIRQARSGVVVVFNDAAYGAELHQYASRGLDDAAMLIEEVDFAALGRALGAQGVKARSLQDLDTLRAWVEGGADGVFVVDLPVSRDIVAQYMLEAQAGAQPAPRPLPVA